MAWTRSNKKGSGGSGEESTEYKFKVGTQHRGDAGDINYTMTITEDNSNGTS